MVNRSSKTGISKGCAFILFRDIEVAQELITGPQNHIFDQKLVEVRECLRKGTRVKKPSEGTLTPRRKKESEKQLSSEKKENGFTDMLKSIDRIKQFHYQPNIRFKFVKKNKNVITY